MSCNCKKLNKLSDANPVELNGLEKAFLFLKKIVLFTLAICSIVILTPIILIGIFYTLIFKSNGTITVPTKVLNMLK